MKILDRSPQEKRLFEIEQTRIRIKELERTEMVLWIEKYAEEVDDLFDYTDAERSYLEGIVDRIDVSLDKTTKDHHLDVVFRLPLVGDGIEYIDANNKSAGYKVVDGDKTSTTILYDSIVKSMGARARKDGRHNKMLKKTSESTYPHNPKRTPP